MFEAFSVKQAANLKCFLIFLGRLRRQCVHRRPNTSFLYSLRNEDQVTPFKCPIYDDLNDKTWFGLEPCAYFGFNPPFGSGHDLYISDNANSNHDSYSNLGNTYQPPPGYQPCTPQTKALLAGSEKFQPSEIEVFCGSAIIDLDLFFWNCDGGEYATRVCY